MPVCMKLTCLSIIRDREIISMYGAIVLTSD